MAAPRHTRFVPAVAAALLGFALATPASAVLWKFEFTFVVEELDDPMGWTGLVGAEAVTGTFTFETDTPGEADRTAGPRTPARSCRSRRRSPTSPSRTSRPRPPI